MTANFLEAGGNVGVIQAFFNLMTTELGNVGGGSAVTSSVGGQSGVFNQSNYANAVWTPIYFKFGGNVTPAVGGFLAGWFLRSTDGGVTFETAVSTPGNTVMALPRSPDFIIPASNAAYANNNIIWVQNGYVKIPWEAHKVVIQNLLGANLTTGNTIQAAGAAIQY